MLIQNNSKKTIAISEAISTFIVFPSMYFPSVCSARNFKQSTTGMRPSVKAIQSVAMSFSVNL